MDKKTMIILNPVSGAGGKAAIRAYVAEQGRAIGAEVVFTEYAGHARLLAADAARNGCAIVMAVGGDGTVNEVASGLVGSETALCIVPTGSGNGLARHLGIPLDGPGAFGLLNNYQKKQVDTGFLNGTAFFCTAGLGFDARISHLFAKNNKRGFWGYAKIIWKEIFSYQPKKFEYSSDKGASEVKAFLLTAANASQFGNDARISPEADIADGQLDFCRVAPFAFWEVFGLLARTFTGTLHRHGRWSAERGKYFMVKNEGDIEAHLDGDPFFFQGNLHFEVRKQSLWVLVPALVLPVPGKKGGWGRFKGFLRR